ncbi:TPA: hypothetical protein LUJ82_000514 [Acinetobacter baumannii]|nr:hypothetical protein [Acinetobacter baumannii]HBM1852729.1 hypothetical protein [Acinetobacter baumannii]HBM1986630.1 hypothetical protein [Acinetobacter baumannii]HBM2032416.1 hypothetical protein [Acinetobacter baumannii]
MKPEQFIREQGLKAIKYCIEEAEAYGGFYVNAKTLELSKHIPSYDAVSITDLKRLMESLDIVRVIGGIEYTRSVLANAPTDAIGYDTMYEGYFGEKTKHYYEDLRTFSIEQIKGAVAVHESIYGGGDES